MLYSNAFRWVGVLQIQRDLLLYITERLLIPPSASKSPRPFKDHYGAIQLGQVQRGSMMTKGIIQTRGHVYLYKAHNPGQ